MTPAERSGPPTTEAQGAPSPLADAIVIEIAALLERFVDTGQAGAIDLRGLPMTEADTARLEALLGRGEVQAELSVVGTSEIWETAYSGVWWARHRGTDARVVAEEIVVARVPMILMTHEDDARAALRRLEAAIAGAGADGIEEERANA